jgi:hypothetical protein
VCVAILCSSVSGRHALPVGSLRSSFFARLFMLAVAQISTRDAAFTWY